MFHVHTQQIYIYPVKSLGGVQCKSIQLAEYGLLNDRRWMIVDRQGNFISQRQYPILNLVKCEQVDSGFALSAPGLGTCIIYHDASDGPNITVKIWNTVMVANTSQPEASTWISDLLQDKHYIVSAQPMARIKSNSFLPEGHELKFQDAYPCHLINTASVRLLEAWAGECVHPLQFRPNFIVDLSHPFEEDGISQWKINGLEFEFVKPCERCIVTTIKPDSATFAKQPLAALSKYRKKNNKVQFGIYLRARKRPVQTS